MSRFFGTILDQFESAHTVIDCSRILSDINQHIADSDSSGGNGQIFSFCIEHSIEKQSDPVHRSSRLELLEVLG